MDELNEDLEEEIFEDNDESEVDMSDLVQKQREAVTSTEINAAVTLLARKPSMIRIIKYLKKKGTRNIKQIRKGIGILTYQRVGVILDKMFQAGVLNCGVTKLDSNHRFYELNENFPADRAIENYKRLVSIRIYKIVPYTGIKVDDLKKDTEFLNLCKKFFVTPDEGIDALKKNARKITVKPYSFDGASYSNLSVLVRKEQ